MGTLFHFDEMLPATDAEAGKAPGSERQVEVFTASGTHNINLRLGELNEEHQGRGFSVHLTEQKAGELLEGLVRAMQYVGYKIPF